MPPVQSDFTFSDQQTTDDIENIQPVFSRSKSETSRRESPHAQQIEDIRSGYDDIDVTIPDGINLCVLFGITQSGKSNLLMYMLSRPENIKYDNYVIFCLSAEQDLYKGFPKSCIKECSIESIEHEIDIQDRIFKRTGATSCFIFDDLIGAVSFQKNNVIDRLSVSGRHSGITSLLLAQDAGKVSSCQRDNASLCFTTCVKNHSLDHLSKMQLDDPKKFISKISATFSDKYSIKRIACQSNEKMLVFKVPKMEKLVRFIL
jgi:hypothetical protein